MRSGELDLLRSSPSGEKWARIGEKRRAGVVVPLFSVYSADSAGIGDLKDLKLLIDWCAKTGNSILQLLPMNDVGPTFCPYDAVSSFALEPSYVSLEPLIADNGRNIKDAASRLKRAFPVGKGSVDYRIKEEKLKLLKAIFTAEREKSDEEVKNFLEENSYWVTDYALFKVLKAHNAGKPWYEWPEEYRDRDPGALETFLKENEPEIWFHLWVQRQLYRQFKEAKRYAESKEVFLKGDLPILISKDSADVWSNPALFKLDLAAGAPPDMYCAKGQRWGMPTYDWSEIAQEEYVYLKEKLKFAEAFYDILRIDHVVGLFRIWSIPDNEPLENLGLNGFFDPRDENVWDDHGRRILSVILNSTKMLLCAEDLGVVPWVCTKALAEFGMPGNDVERWTKDWNVKHDFLEPEEYRFLSVAMLSTHDTTNWAAWWEDEAGTVDEALFIRRCAERGIDYQRAKPKLFDPKLSRHGRLRWRDTVKSAAILAEILKKEEGEAADFIDMYNNSFQEKEKLWKHLRLDGRMRERSDAETVGAAINVTLRSRSIFSIQLVLDWLMFGGIFKGDPYKYRVNTPGTVRQENWSIVLPLSLEALLKHEVSDKIRSLIKSSKRTGH